jgi:hypothetical protein
VLPQKLTNILTILISLVWTANVVAGFIRPELRDPMINAIFAVVVGAIYALGRRTNTTSANVVDDARRRLGDLISGNRDEHTDPGAQDPPPPPTGNSIGGDRT